MSRIERGAIVVLWAGVSFNFFAPPAPEDGSDHAVQVFTVWSPKFQPQPPRLADSGGPPVGVMVKDVAAENQVVAVLGTHLVLRQAFQCRMTYLTALDPLRP